MFKTRFISMLVLLMTAVTGAWAQEQSETIVTTTDGIVVGAIVEGTHFKISNGNKYADGDGMSAEDDGITVTPKNGETITKVVISCTFGSNSVNDGNTSVSSGTKEITNDGGTITVTGVNASTFTFTCSDPGPQFGQFVVYYTGAPAASTYTVILKEGTDDADKWTITPAEATTTGVAAGTTVTATYGGTKKVKSVKAVKKAAAPAGPTLDLATVTEATTVEDGYTLTGTLGANVKISIADGATVTLDGVTINGVNNDSYSWAGITCLGDATIILSGTNTVKGFYEDYPGIYVPENKTLTIEGSGSLTASSNGYGCGIGGGYEIACGNIEIQGGTVTATGGISAAGIGSGFARGCGAITISGGNVTATGGNSAAGIGSGSNYSYCGDITISGGTVAATGGDNAAGIGSGNSRASCGDITITSGVTHVTATKGDGAPNSIGASSSGSCGTVTIEDESKVTKN